MNFNFLTAATILCLSILVGQPSAAQTTTLPSFTTPKLAWTTNTIPVCWEKTGLSQTTEKAWVKDAVVQTWERHSPLRFVGWSTCASSARGIRIRVDDSGPRSIVGRSIDGKRDGMHLNFQFKSWSTVCAATQYREKCIRRIAVHEFGHAIGFLHEQDRPDVPKACRDQHVTDPDHLKFADVYGVMVGAYDPDSIMNYCASQHPDAGQGLSSTDILGLSYLYGQLGPFLNCIVHGTRNTKCCSQLSTSEQKKTHACSNRVIPDQVRLGYFKLCQSTNGPRCCDHLTAGLAKKYGCSPTNGVRLANFNACVKDGFPRCCDHLTKELIQRRTAPKLCPPSN